jgi:hypothetical protein
MSQYNEITAVTSHLNTLFKETLGKMPDLCEKFQHTMNFHPLHGEITAKNYYVHCDVGSLYQN